ncbi:hypothetical protein VB776_08225 [Arcicella sp. DC2W]|uniref:Uncharacterized protein n=1 Tax=Arcicella gelida TaxID=2984195 RepID=A0ABU5S326_9BACT|nr:hypothetical protein [Arcicella sp. DC2W]MEA5402897.1 hypothetical protein [Arcicella sp. DC2W]
MDKNFGTTKIDSLVNNVGMGYYASIEDTTEAGFDEMATTHLKAPFSLLKNYFHSLMKACVSSILLRV